MVSLPSWTFPVLSFARHRCHHSHSTVPSSFPLPQTILTNVLAWQHLLQHSCSHDGHSRQAMITFMIAGMTLHLASATLLLCKYVLATALPFI